MNSFNHYAYGAVADWIYEVAAGITQTENSAGFEELVIAPHPDKRLEWLEASIDSARGNIFSKWSYMPDGSLKYEISIPCRARVIIGQRSRELEAGTYVFYETQ